LIAGTNRDLRDEVASGEFREDLFARINLWTFELPGLKDRREDIEPNLDYELERFAEREGNAVSFNKEARVQFLEFARDPATEWRGNFRDLNAAMVRMGTLAPRGRIRSEEVGQELERLRSSWERGSEDDGLGGLVEGGIDSFDRVQLAHVVKVCRESKTLSEAGRKLFAESRKKKANPNDSDRVRKFLAKFGIGFADL
jgi:transcriptional regulatory protein RtcR